jgi:hypothetical protein
VTSRLGTGKPLTFFYSVSCGKSSPGAFVWTWQQGPTCGPTPPPPHQRRGGTHSPGGEGVGGQYFGRRQTYSLISLRKKDRQLADVRGGGGVEEPIHMTARKPGPL